MGIQVVTLTQARLKELIQYNPDTGEFYRKFKDPKRNKIINSITAYNYGKKYYRFMLDTRLYLAHRLAFLYMTGSFPRHDVDHINGNGLDNRWTNIRAVTRLENSQNRKLNSNTTSGFCGVSWNKSKSKWMVQISSNGTKHYLGYYQTLLDAVAARINASIKYNFHPNHGKIL